MARGGNVRIAITADPDGVRRGTAQAERDLDRLGKSSGASLGKLKGAGLAAGAGIGIAALAITDLAKHAASSEQVQKRMEAQLKASGLSYRAHADEIERVIQKTSKLSALDDEDLKDAFTNIVRVTGDVNQSLKLTGLAADFARAKHIDVAKAGEIVGKVAGGNIGILSRYGIQVDKGASSTEALGLLQQKFAGQAKAYGQTTSGAFERAKVQIDNVKERLGTALLPVLAKGANAVAGLAESAQRNWPQVSRLAGTVGRGISTGFTAAKQAISDFVDRNRDDINTFIRAVRNVGTAVKVVFEDVVVPVIKRMLPGIRQTFQGAITVVRGAVRVISGLLTGNFGKAWDGVKDIFSGGIRMILGNLRTMTAPVREAGARVGKAIWSGIKSAFTTAGGFAANIGQAIRDWLNRVTPFGNEVNVGPIHFRIPALARGGAIAGGRPGRDSVPALLMPGEHVWTASEVRAAGGHGAVFAMRRALGGGGQASGVGMAAGGAVAHSSAITSPPAGAGPAWRWASAFARKYNLRITSSWRSAAQNRAAGGVPNSHHMRGTPQNPDAFDFLPPSSAAASAARRDGAGEVLIHDAGSGLHLHVGGLGFTGRLGQTGSGGSRRVQRPANRKRYGIRGLAELALYAGFKGENAAVAAAVAMAESGGDSGATNTAGNSAGVDRGLWQINSYYNPGHSDSDCFNPLKCAKIAYAIWKRRGWRDWVTYTTGRHRQYLAAARKAVKDVDDNGSELTGKKIKKGKSYAVKGKKTGDQATDRQESAWQLAQLTPSLADDLDAASQGFLVANAMVRTAAEKVRRGGDPQLLADAISNRDEWLSRYASIRNQGASSSLSRYSTPAEAAFLSSGQATPKALGQPETTTSSDAGSGDDGNLQAQLSQAEERTRVAQRAAALSGSFIKTVTGLGDVGAGQPIVIQTLTPGDPNTLRAVAAAAAGGFAMQGYVPTSREELGV